MWGSAFWRGNVKPMKAVTVRTPSTLLKLSLSGEYLRKQAGTDIGLTDPPMQRLIAWRSPAGPAIAVVIHATVEHFPVPRLALGVTTLHDLEDEVEG